MNIAEVKALLGITTSKHDDYLDAVVPIFVEDAKAKTNNDFLDAEGREVLPGPVKLYVAKACQYNMNETGLKSYRMGEVSYTYETEFPPSITDLLKRYKRVRFI